MEASRLTFTKEFKEKTMKGLSRRRIGELRWERLLKLDEEGALQSIHNRREMGALVGITQPKMYHAWVSSLIKKGRLSETLRGFENGKSVFEYHIESRVTTTTPEKKKPVMHTVPMTEPVVCNEQIKHMTITVTLQNAILKMEDVTTDAAIEIIKALSK